MKLPFFHCKTPWKTFNCFLPGH